MGSITTRIVTSSSDEETEKRNEIEIQMRKRGIRKYLNTIRMESEEETDMETIQERKEILMTEMEYILDTLWLRKRRENTLRVGPLIRKAENRHTRARTEK